MNKCNHVQLFKRPDAIKTFFMFIKFIEINAESVGNDLMPENYAKLILNIYNG